MLTYPYVNLPEYYVRLLKEAMQGVDFNSNQFTSYVYENKPFLALIENHFYDIDPQLRVDAILKGMTWKGVRNRMARLFIHYELNGKFGLDEEDMKHLNDILSWEEHLVTYQVEGFSRMFLLGFYFKICSLQTRRISQVSTFRDFMIRNEVLELFKYCKSRAICIDWLYVIMDHFTSYLGKKKMLAILEDRLSYQNIFSMLNEEQRRNITSGLLTYGASISEPEIFAGESLLF